MKTNYEYRYMAQRASRYKSRSDKYRIDRDDWKAKSLAYREIIRKSHNALAQNLPELACDFLQEINKLDPDKLDKEVK